VPEFHQIETTIFVVGALLAVGAVRGSAGWAPAVGVRARLLDLGTPTPGRKCRLRHPGGASTERDQAT
jgi:hypothetical protein